MDGLSDSHIAGKKLFLAQGDKPQLIENQQQQKLLQQKGADERIEQYQDEEDEVKSKAEGKDVQNKGM